MKKKLMLSLVLVVAVIILTGCGVQTNPENILTPETASGPWQTFLVLPLILFLTWLNDVFGNLGVAIIIATIATKALVMPLMLKSMKSTAKMQELQPEMEKIKKKYAGKADRGAQVAMNQEMSLLYRERGVNPLAGCLPMLIQMPLMFGFFQAFSRHPLIAGADGSAYFLGMNLSAIQTIPNVIFAAIVAGLMYYSQSRQATMLSGNQQGAAPNAKMMNMMFLPMMALTVYFSPLAMGLYFLVSQIMMTIQSFILKKPSTTPAPF